MVPGRQGTVGWQPLLLHPPECAAVKDLRGNTIDSSTANPPITSNAQCVHQTSSSKATPPATEKLRGCIEHLQHICEDAGEFRGCVGPALQLHDSTF